MSGTSEETMIDTYDCLRNILTVVIVLVEIAVLLLTVIVVRDREERVIDEPPRAL